MALIESKHATTIVTSPGLFNFLLCHLISQEVSRDYWSSPLQPLSDSKTTDNPPPPQPVEVQVTGEVELPVLISMSNLNTVRY